MSDRPASGKNERALPEIVKQQARKCDRQPSQHNRPAAKMTEISVERFSPGYGKAPRAAYCLAEGAINAAHLHGPERPSDSN